MPVEPASQGVQVNRPRRPTVRIVGRRSQLINTLITFAVVGGCGLTIFGIWLFLKPQPEPAPHQRNLADIPMNWRCTNGHAFTAYGSMTPRPCPTCSARAFVVDIYECPEHGLFEAAVQFGIDKRSGKPVATHFRLKDGDWTPKSQGLRCRRCSRPLSRVLSSTPRARDE